MTSTLEKSITVLDPLTRLARIEAYGTDAIPTQQELDVQAEADKRIVEQHNVGTVAVAAAQIAERHAA